MRVWASRFGVKFVNLIKFDLKFEQKEPSGNIAWLDEAVLKFKRALGI